MKSVKNVSGLCLGSALLIAGLTITPDVSAMSTASTQEGDVVLTTDTIIRAWKDEAFRLSLCAEHRRMLPEHPAGIVELSDTDAMDLTGRQKLLNSFVCTRWVGGC